MNTSQTSNIFLKIIKVNTTSNSININSTTLRNFTILVESESWDFSDVMLGIFWGGVFGITVGGGACVMGYTWVKCSDRVREAGRLIEDYNENDSAKGACICFGSIVGVGSAIIGFIQSKEISGDTSKKSRILQSENEALLNDDYNDLALQI